MSVDPTKQAFIKAQQVITDCSCRIGIKASALSNGYSQIWARDSMITLLGAITLNDPQINTSLKVTLKTLGKYQSSSGCIPSNVVVKDHQADFRSYMDGNCWYILGQSIYYNTFNDLAFLQKSWSKIKKTLVFLESQDVYQTGLLAMQEAADWLDHIAIRGRSLGVNALYYQALISAAGMAELFKEPDLQEEYLLKAEFIKQAIRKLFWVDIKQFEFMEDFVNEEFNILSGHKLALLRERPYFIPYIGFREVGTWFDIFANLLTIIFGIANKVQTGQILDYIEAVGANNPSAVKAIYPPIYPGDNDWRDYYLNKNLNLPHHYHNGGIWPFIGGFYIAALLKAGRTKQAKKELTKLAILNKQGISNPWEFNEWHHGITGKPMGKKYQAWSAGMYIYAYNSVNQNKALHF